MESSILYMYLLYSMFVVGLTIFVSYHLYKSGMAFMLDIFNNRTEMAASTNKLFQIGYLLFGLGIGFMMLQTNVDLVDMQIALEEMARKMGGFSVILGVLMFIYLYLFFRGKRVSAQNRRNEEEAVEYLFKKGDA